MKKHDASDRDVYFSKKRYLTALNALSGFSHENCIEHAKNILSGKYGFMCQYSRGLDFDTVWSSIFDVTGDKIYRAEGNPGRTGFIEEKRLNPVPG